MIMVGAMVFGPAQLFEILATDSTFEIVTAFLLANGAIEWNRFLRIFYLSVLVLCCCRVLIYLDTFRFIDLCNVPPPFVGRIGNG